MDGIPNLCGSISSYIAAVFLALLFGLPNCQPQVALLVYSAFGIQRIPHSPIFPFIYILYDVKIISMTPAIQSWLAAFVQLWLAIFRQIFDSFPGGRTAVLQPFPLSPFALFPFSLRRLSEIEFWFQNSIHIKRGSCGVVWCGVGVRCVWCVWVFLLVIATNSIDLTARLLWALLCWQPTDHTPNFLCHPFWCVFICIFFFCFHPIVETCTVLSFFAAQWIEYAKTNPTVDTLRGERRRMYVTNILKICTKVGLPF